MILKKTYVALSQIPGAGLGFFAGEDIRAGEVIWECSDYSLIMWTPEEWEALREEFRKCVEVYVYHHEWDGNYKLVVDDSRFLNHSYTPNTEGSEDVHAIVDIPKGTEILTDYREFCTKEWFEKALPGFRFEIANE